MISSVKLSQTDPGKAWIANFKQENREAAAELLDAMLLVNDEQVATSIRTLLSIVGAEAKEGGYRVGLYAEREFAEAQAFESKLVPDANGRLRRRAVGEAGPVAVEPKRGSRRVGSEGWIASIISSAIRATPGIFSNQPGPDRIRSKRSPIKTLVIVTDFIGSGKRVNDMLDKFWAVPTVKSWVSRKLISFAVVAAVATRTGLDAVKKHHLAPDVRVDLMAPSIYSRSAREMKLWTHLIETEGPKIAGEDPFGFKKSAALVAFSYAIPNNAPLFLRVSRGKGKKRWHALYEGHIPSGAREAFSLKSEKQRVADAGELVGVELDSRLRRVDAETVLVLISIRGRLRQGAQIGIAEEIGLPVPDVESILRRATKAGLLDPNGRLTDAGQRLVRDGKKSERRRPPIPTNPEPYYPVSLRVSGG